MAAKLNEPSIVECVAKHIGYFVHIEGTENCFKDGMADGLTLTVALSFVWCRHFRFIAPTRVCAYSMNQYFEVDFIRRQNVTLKHSEM